MPFYKCCSFLMIMVSPQIVGLILFCLIGVPSSALLSSPSPEPSSDLLKSPKTSSIVKVPKYATRLSSIKSSEIPSPTAKWGVIYKNSPRLPPKPITATIKSKENNNEIPSNMFLKNVTIARNVSEIALDSVLPPSQVPSFPIKLNPHSSENISTKLKQPINVNNRPDFIKSSDSIFKASKLESVVLLSMRDVLEVLSHNKSSNTSSTPDSNPNDTIRYFDALRLFKNAKDAKNEIKGKSSVVEGTDGKELTTRSSASFSTQNSSNYTKKSYSPPSTTIKASQTTIKHGEHLSDGTEPIARSSRRGRNYQLPENSKSREGHEIISESSVFIARISLNDTAENISRRNPKASSGVFNYTYHISAVDRGSVFPHDPFLEFENSNASKSSSNPLMIPIEKNESSYTVAPNSNRNLTIYEILKPRLRPSASFQMGDIPKKLTLRPELSSLVENGTTVSTKNSTSRNETSDMLPGNGAIEYEDTTKDNQNNTNILKYYVTSNQTNVAGIISTISTTASNNSGASDNDNNTFTLPERSDSNYAMDTVSVNGNTSDNSETFTLTFNASNGEFNSSENSSNYSISYIAKSESKETNVSSSINITHDNLSILTTDSYGVNHTELNDTRKNQTNLYRSFVYFDDEKESEKRAPPARNWTEGVAEVVGDASEAVTQLHEPDLIRQPKMSDSINKDNAAFKKPKIDPKLFYDYFAKFPTGNVSSQDLPYPEFRPGSLFRYADIYRRKPVLDVVYSPPTPAFEIFKPKETEATEESIITPTTFDSMRTSVRVSSTFYPNRIQDMTMKFGNRFDPPTTVPTISSNGKNIENRNDDEPDDAEYRDAIDPGFTMEKLAYLLIGTCCGLSILCLCVVVIAIKCRRVIVEKRLKSQFRRRMYQHERMKDPSTPWQQQMFDHFMYMRRHPDSSSSSADSCNCRCVTWSLGPRNLDASRPICPTNRSSLYLCGQKKLPFGAASTLRYESMLGRKRPSPGAKNESPNTESSHENDSLDQDSDSRESDTQRQCTCINYSMWPIVPDDMRHGFYGLCPTAGRCNVGDCVQHPAVELRSIARDVPPPVTGSNYLDRSEGVVYWSSNEERLI